MKISTILSFYLLYIIEDKQKTTNCQAASGKKRSGQSALGGAQLPKISWLLWV